MRILLIEDDKKMAGYIAKGLRESGFAVDHECTGKDGLIAASASEYDILVVDLMLPELDGLSVIQTVRKLNSEVGIIILSAKHALDDKVKGLQVGADDYLTKPFAFSELLARVQALLRRRSVQAADSTELSFADLKMSLLSREVTRGDQRIDLQQKEFALLEYLLRNAGRVITRTMILEHVWDINFDPSTNIVDVLICRLRDKIDRDFDIKLIHTVRGAGYALKIE